MCRGGKLTFDVSVHYPSIMKTFQSFTKFSGNDDDVSLPKLIVRGTHLVLRVSNFHPDHQSRSSSNIIRFSSHLICGRIFSTKTSPQQVCAPKQKDRNRRICTASGFCTIIQVMKKSLQASKHPQKEPTWAAKRKWKKRKNTLTKVFTLPPGQCSQTSQS